MPGTSYNVYGALHAAQQREEDAQKAAIESISPEGDPRAVKTIKDAVAAQFSGQLGMGGGISPEQREEIQKFIDKQTHDLPVSVEEKAAVRQSTINDVLLFGKLQPLMSDPTVTDINVIGPNTIRVEKGGVSYIERSISFSDEELKTLIERLLNEQNRPINVSNQSANAQLTDGSRICAVIPPAAAFPTIAIRKFTDYIKAPTDYIQAGAMSEKMLRFLELCVRGRINIIVSGGTGAGKTTLLNMLSSYIPATEYVITVEDTRELKLRIPAVTNLVSNENITLAELVDGTLRMNPDRIIVGEIRTRDGVLSNMLTAMSTGHEGSMSTIHANNPYDLVNDRIVRLYDNTPGAGMSQESICAGFASAVELIVHINKLPTGKRVVTHITQVNGVLAKSGRVKLDNVFRYDLEKGFVCDGFIPEKIILHAKANGIEIPTALFGTD